jgi:hypothetical protein
MALSTRWWLGAGALNRHIVPYLRPSSIHGASYLGSIDAIRREFCGVVSKAMTLKRLYGVTFCDCSINWLENATYRIIQFGYTGM